MNKKLGYIILVLLCSCGMGGNSAYDFTTRASYLAEQSAIQAELTANGHVYAGADLGYGIAEGILTSPNLEDTIRFKTNEFEFLELNYSDYILDTTNLVNSKLNLNYFLDSIEYTAYDSKEIIELREIIMLTTYGPKGTYMDGQTELVKVIHVEFESKRSPKPSK